MVSTDICCLHLFSLPLSPFISDRSLSVVISLQPNCFELFGYDVLIDESLDLWLLEVNSSPSMALGTEEDRKVSETREREREARVPGIFNFRFFSPFSLLSFCGVDN